MRYKNECNDDVAFIDVERGHFLVVTIRMIMVGVLDRPQLKRGDVESVFVWA